MNVYRLALNKCIKIKYQAIIPSDTYYHCVPCGQNIPNSESLKKHNNVFHGDRFKDKSILSHAINKGAPCPNLMFTSLLLLGEGPQVIPQEESVVKSARCTTCNEAFCNDQSLQAHVQRYHVLFACEECHKRFLVKEHLVDHVENVHAMVQNVPYTTIGEVDKVIYENKEKKKVSVEKLKKELEEAFVLFMAHQEDPLERESIEN